jgi:hypothetical protein
VDAAGRSAPIGVTQKKVGVAHDGEVHAVSVKEPGRSYLSAGNFHDWHRRDDSNAKFFCHKLTIISRRALLRAASAIARTRSKISILLAACRT